MMPQWLMNLAQAVFWVAAMTVTMRWLARTRRRALPAQDADHLRQPGSMLAIGIVGTLFCIGIIVAFTIWPDDSSGFWSYAFFYAFTLLPLFIVADYFNGRHDVSESGMDVGRASGRRLSFAWDEVAGIRYAQSAGWFKIALRSGATVRISVMLMGLPVFADKLLRHVPNARIEADALKVLKEAAAGKLPGIWG